MDDPPRAGDGPGALESARRAFRLAEPAALAALVDRVVGDRLGADRTTIWLIDYAEQVLQSLAPGAEEPAATVPVGAGAVGDCYVRQQPVVGPAGPVTQVAVPLNARTERLGVLEVRLGHPRDGAALVADTQSMAQAIADAIAVGRPYTDLVPKGRRTRHLTLAAEMQWELLQPGSYDGTRFRLAARLEPAYEIGGDHYDYAAQPDQVTISIVDGMGHGLRAALLGSLATGAMRNARRNGGDCAQQARAINAALCEQFGGEQFVTGLIIEIDLRRERALAVNAGHPQAIRLRADRLEELGTTADRPYGLFPDSAYRSQPVSLRPDDRLVLLSDGVLEATSEGGEEFGSGRLAELLLSMRSESPATLVRVVTEAVLAHRGAPLGDDATVLCFDWCGHDVEASAEPA